MKTFNITNIKGKNYNYLKSYDIQTNENLLSICVDNVFNSNECDELIRATENIGYIRASLFDKNGKQYFYPEIRESLRCIVDDVAFSSVLEKRLIHLIPKIYRGKKYHSINPRFRCLKYNDTTHHFIAHTDDCYSNNEIMSMITILIYTNKDYEGARTSLHLDEKTIIGEIEPKVGMIYLMDQDILHSVPNLISGTKYIIRTELMFLIK